MKFSYLFVISFLFTACNDAGKQQPAAEKDTLIKPVIEKDIAAANPPVDLFDRITDSLMKLDFVQKSNRYIDSFSHHKSGIAFLQDSSENKIMITAGYNGKERFEKYYLFLVDPKSFDIKINDAISGDWLSVEEYKKRNPDN